MAADENNEKSSDSRNLRLYSSDGQRSARMECDSQTSCGDICQHFSADCVTLQIGNFHFRQLKSDTSPLTILTDFCRILCMSEDAFGESSSSTADQLVRSVMAYTDSSSFRHIFSFFLGRPRIRSKSSLTSSGILSEEVLMRKGKLLPTWSNANAVFHNSTIRIQTKQNQDEILHLRSMKIDVQESKRGRGIRFRGSDTSNQYLLIFQRPNILQLWLSKAQQIEKSSHIDLSDEQLTLIPENVLNNEGDIQVLNLRRNSLISRPQTEKTMSHLGYVDDLYRIQSLQVVDLSANQIVTFPIQLTLLAHLRQINLSSNFIGTVPKEVGNMRRLQYLNLSNNLIDSIPNEIVNCFNLVSFDLSFNQFSQVPDCLNQLKIDMWRLSGNNIEKIDRVGHVPTDKLDLRRNILDTSFRLDIENVTHLDIRDNSLISTVHLTNLRFLKTIRCERLQLTSLHLNGESLTHIFADHNLLDSLVVMPLPEGLQTLSISYNHFRCLPDWISDCQHLNFLRANNNRLEVLPDRIFCSTSLKCIFAFDNLIQQLPDEAESNCLETLILYKNRINKLPRHFFGMMPKLRQLNISSNFIEILPYIDLNLICRIQIFRAANNCLTENCVPIIINMKHLKVLDLSHNFLCSFDDSALTSLDLLEEINVSSNRLTRLSGCFGTLPNLQILRAHSNRLVDIPHLATCQQLHTIDVSSNMISLGSLEFQAPPTLRHFDVTCNSGDFVTDQNWLIPKMNMINIADGQHSLHEFQIGVSGSRGSKNKQCIRQLRVNNTFAFIDGGSNFYMSSSICRFLSQHLREHPDDDIRTTLLKCHCELGEEGERLGASVLILQLSGANIEIASIGTICVVLSRNGKFQFVIDGRYEIDDDEYSRIREAHGFVDEENRINGIVKSSRQIGHFAMFPIVLPTHFYKNLINDETIDGLIIANSSLWSMMTIDDVSDVFNNNRSPIVIAKKLQDKLQSFDYGGNSNILVMRRIKPQIIFQNHIDEEEKLDEVAVAMPAIVSPTVSTPIPATRATYRTPSPPPPPLPTSTPPIFEEDEEEAMQIEMKSTYSLSIDRYQETISKRQFNETRDLLSKSLKLSPPSTVTFNI